MYKSDVTWPKIKKSAAPDILMKYCPSRAAAKKKGRPKKDARKLGNADHIKQGVAKRRCINPVAPDTTIEDAHENATQVREFVELKLNQFVKAKDGLVGKA